MDPDAEQEAGVDPRKERDKGETDFFNAYEDDDDAGDEF